MQTGRGGGGNKLPKKKNQDLSHNKKGLGGNYCAAIGGNFKPAGEQSGSLWKIFA